MRDKNVSVFRQDATSMSFPDSSFDGAVSFTMLHHVASEALQNRLLAEVARVLRPVEFLRATDSLYSRSFGLLHLLTPWCWSIPAPFRASEGCWV